MKPVLYLFVCCLVFTLFACKKDKKTPIEQLPAATQSGKNTFGCLINGQAWLPKGSFPAGDINPAVSYDPSFENGALNVHAYRIDNNRKLEIVVAGKNIDKVGVYTLGTAGSGALQGAMVVDSKGSCRYSGTENGTSCTGTLEITKLDVIGKIIAGTFSFTISTPGCETLEVTDGRFDLRLY